MVVLILISVSSFYLSAFVAGRTNGVHILNRYLQLGRCCVGRSDFQRFESLVITSQWVIGTNLFPPVTMAGKKIVRHFERVVLYMCQVEKTFLTTVAKRRVINDRPVSTNLTYR